jgi:glutaredoxin
MKSKATFYHAGCPVCLDAEKQLANAVDPNRYELEIVHLGQAKHRLIEAERSGVQSVPALVLDGAPLHINFGAPLSALK